jgi:cytochrome c
MRMQQSIAANASLAKAGQSALLSFAALLIALPIGTPSAFAQLRGHGGPVRALAISADGQSAISGSFDSTAIRWSLTRNAAEQVLRFHSDAVNAVVLLGERRAATAGADGRIAIWTFGKTEPDAVFEGHTAPIVALAVSPDGATLASASWDHTVRLWPLAGGAPRVLDEHTQNVNGVAFTADGRALVSVSYDLSVRIWPLSGAQTPTVVTMPTPLNAVAADCDFARRCAGCCSRHWRHGRRDRPQGAHAHAHAGRSGPAGLVGGLPARRPHFADRRR